MVVVSFAEAARRLGHKSRSTLYRLKEEHRLDHYLVDGPNGFQLLELTPPGRPTLEAYLAAVLDPGRGPRASRRDQRAQRNRRWDLVAAILSAALEEIGGPSLTSKEAELLALQLGPATWEVFPEGLPTKTPEELGYVMRELWNPMATAVNGNLVADGWRLPPLSGKELQQVSRWVGHQQEETVWDTESMAWWKMTLEDNLETEPGDPCPDPWRCEWCGEPWHYNHPEHRSPPQVEAYQETVRESLRERGLLEKTSEDLKEPSSET